MAVPPRPPRPSLAREWIRFLLTPKGIGTLIVLGFVLDWIRYPKDFQAFVPMAIVLGMGAYGIVWFRQSISKKKKKPDQGH